MANQDQSGSRRAAKSFHIGRPGTIRMLTLDAMASAGRSCCAQWRSDDTCRATIKVRTRWTSDWLNRFINGVRDTADEGTQQTGNFEAPRTERLKRHWTVSPTGALS